MKIAFYVSGKANRLRQIIKKSDQSLLENISFVFSEDTSTVDLQEILKPHGISYCLYDYRSLTGDKNLSLSNRLLELLIESNSDYCFCFGRHILKGDLLKKYALRIINFHPSILPQFRGVKAIDQALKEGVSVLGNTAHFIDENVDTGPIIAQNVMSKKRFDKYGYDGILDSQFELFQLVYKLLNQNRIHVNDKGIVEIEGASYDDIMYIPNILDKNSLT